MQAVFGELIYLLFLLMMSEMLNRPYSSTYFGCRVPLKASVYNSAALHVAVYPFCFRVSEMTDVQKSQKKACTHALE